MKQSLKAYLFSIIIIIMLALLVSLIMGTLFFFHITDTNLLTGFIWVFGILLYAVGGMLFGHYTSKKILIHLLIIMIIILSFYFILMPFDGFTFVRTLCKLLAFSITTIFIQNKKGFN